jgi:hypothetical protein
LPEASGPPDKRPSRAQITIGEAVSDGVDDAEEFNLKDAVRKILDRQEILNIVTLYCRAVDRGDANLLRSIYWKDAVEDHGISMTGVDEFVEMAMNIVNSCVSTHHQIGNVLIQLDGDTAKVETYVHLHQRIEGLPSPYWPFQPKPIPENQKGRFTDFFAGARYLDIMERRSGTWRIKHRKVANDWFQVMPGESWDKFPYPGAEHFNIGSHTSADAAYKFFARYD